MTKTEKKNTKSKKETSTKLNISRIVYEQKRSDRNYGSVGASVEILLTKKDDIDDAWTLAKTEVEKQIAVRLEEATTEPRIGRAPKTVATSQKSTAPTKPKILKGEALEKFKEENAEAVYNKAIEIFGEDQAVGDNINSAALVLAREMGTTSLPTKTISALTIDDRIFDLKVKVDSISEPIPYIRKDGSEGSRMPIVFSDTTGQITTTLFDGQQKIAKDIKADDEILIQEIFTVGEFRGELQLNLGNRAKIQILKKAPDIVQESL